MVDTASDRTEPDPDGRRAGLRERFKTLVERGRRVLHPGHDRDSATPGGTVTTTEDVRSRAADDSVKLPEAERTRLTDEERVRYHLRRSGRMGQSELVERTGWSKAKVSRVLSAMEEEGAVSRAQVGREKIVTLPESGVDDPLTERHRRVTGRSE